MITLENDQLVFRFPGVHENAVCRIGFVRTLRLPDDGKTYPLPAGVGTFPLRHLDDYSSRLRPESRDRGGVVMPMYQSEALWLNFGSDGSYPFAVKIATGKVCAVSGGTWFNHLNQDPQDYVVVPDQPWLDGFCVKKGVIRQFVATSLGKGQTVEEQVRESSDIGGMQIAVYPLKRKYYREVKREARVYLMAVQSPAPEMGLAAGGRMHQEIYKDKRELHVWDMRNGSRCFVTIANSLLWKSITGENPPHVPLNAKQYANYGIPWFEYYKDAPSLDGSKILAGVKSIGSFPNEAGGTDHSSIKIDPDNVVRASNSERSSIVREFNH